MGNPKFEIFSAEVVDKDTGETHKMFPKRGSKHLFYYESMQTEEGEYRLQLRLDPRGDERGHFQLDVDCWKVGVIWKKKLKNKNNLWHHPRQKEENGVIFYEFSIPEVCTKKIITQGKEMGATLSENSRISSSLGIKLNGVPVDIKPIEKEN
ncbi:hypothetical protein K9M59_00180 [Candidatus Gracilibacteria bacterium]|nr:hypothetical protein [Candidatus Gracilibacteria bacterium]MCF7819002.1 hypothetical protein [Candidatus Gracilibacteria bacterium]